MATNSAFPGPTPPYSNPPIEPENFKPSRFEISALTLGTNTTVTTSTTHNYVIGQLIRFLIPEPYGSYQLNQLTGYVVSLPSTTQVTVALNSAQNVNPFVPSPTYSLNSPQIVAVGDINSGIQSATGLSISTTTIPGSFQNISS